MVIQTAFRVPNFVPVAEHKCRAGIVHKIGMLMVFDILTKEDLQQFKKELLEEIKQVLKRENPGNSGDKEWLRSREVRKKLDISPGTLQNLRITGILPFKKIGGSMYYRSSDVDKMMEGGNGNG
ncbi:helix-turn-helix domain-containing protein [Sphingobacterium sp. HSC-15S19]|uniref:helix-turn-helix domain-containing protein n=1 Tax=Sphingobacterium sp. HSC-15S19 TaxID=2910971 RepID=UPI003D1B931E